MEAIKDAATDTGAASRASLRDIVEAKNLSVEEKIKRLQERELDLRQILVAAEEGMMQGDDPKYRGQEDPGVALRRVQEALKDLGAESVATPSPTKAGG